MGQHMEHIGDVQSKSDLGYVSTVSRYRARNCVGCPLRCLCYKGKGDRRIIEVNHRSNAFRAKAIERLTSEEGLYPSHRAGSGVRRHQVRPRLQAVPPQGQYEGQRRVRPGGVGPQSAQICESTDPESTDHIRTGSGTPPKDRSNKRSLRHLGGV